MLFPQLDKYKSEDPDLDDILFKLNEYLNKKLGEIINFQNLQLSIRYKQFAADFGLSKEDALLAFDLCVDEEILLPEYEFFCPETDNSIGKYYSLKDVPKLLPCGYHFHIETHESVHCPLEIRFRFSPLILRDLRQIAA